MRNVIFLLCLSMATSVKIDCKHKERIREDHIHNCCKHPDGHNDITENCAIKTKFKLPSPTEEAPEDVTVDQAVSGTCWAECVFSAYNFFTNQTLNMEKVRQHYKQLNDQEYEKEMVNAFEHCHDKSIDDTARFLSMPMFQSSHDKMCNPRASVTLACVIHYFFHNCPTSRWAHTDECNETKAFASKCKDELTTM